MMTRLIILIGLLTLTISAGAQPEHYTSARRYLSLYTRDQNADDLNKARTHIDRAAVHDSTRNLPKTWLLRGEIYMYLYLKNVNDKKLENNALDIASKTKAAFISADDSLLLIAGNSLLRCLELDATEPHKEACHNYMVQIASLSQSAGVAKFSAEQFNDATTCFHHAFVLQQKIGRFDSIALFNSALSGMKARQYERSIAWSKELLAVNYNFEGSSWVLSQNYLESGDLSRADTMIRKGLQQLPESRMLRVQFIEQRLLVGDTAAADSVVQHLCAIKGIPGANDAVLIGDYYRFLLLDPDVMSQWAGKRLSETQLIQRAEFWYAEALKVQPAFFEPRYNLGTLYYNLGVRERKNAETDPTPVARQIWENWFLKSAAELELALQIRSKDIAVLNALKTVYTQLGDTANYQRIKEMEK